MKYINKLSIILILFSLIILSVSGQIPAPPQKGPIALVGGTIYTVSDGIIENGIVVFKNGEITAVGIDVELAPDVKRIDVRGKHIYPGLIHARSLVGLTEIGSLSETSDFNELGNINPNVRAEVAVHPESEHIPVARSGGVAVSVATPTGGIISGLSAAIMMDGWTWEQMTLKPSVGLVVNWPSPAAREENYRNQITELRDAFSAARRYMIARRNRTVDHNADTRWEAMMSVLNKKVPVYVVANDLRQIQDALTWAESEDVMLVLVGGYDVDKVIPQIRERDIPVVISPVIGSPARPWVGYDDIYTLPSRLHKAGIRFCIAGETSAAYAFRLSHHAIAAVAFGLPMEEALKAVTLYPAEILGIAERVGTIEVGKDATMIITDGDILEFSTVVEHMFIEGKTIDMTNRHRSLYEKYDEKYRQITR